MDFRQKTSLLMSESSSDSDNESNWKKKSTRKDIDSTEKCDESGTKKKAHEMWTENLIEQTLDEGFGHCRVKNPPENVYNRGSESYDFTRKPQDPKEDSEPDDAAAKPQVQMDFGYDYSQKSDDDDLEEFGVVKKQKIKVPKLKERLGEKQFKNFSTQKVADEIIRKLKEQKPDLIHRCVQFLGPKKCMELLSMTLSIESDGGMKTVDGTRRRTPGGVFFQLLKNDPNVRKDEMDKIFEDSKKEQDKMKKAFRKMKRRKEAKKVHALKERGPLTVTDLLPQGTAGSLLAKETNSDIEEGEIMD